MAQNRDKRGEMGAQDDLDEHTVFINRCAKTVKGGSSCLYAGAADGGPELTRVLGDRWFDESLCGDAPSAPSP